MVLRTCVHTLQRRGYGAVASQSRPRVIFSGIQPTGTPHLGNYLGAVSNWIQLQQDPDAQILYSIVDLHALTMPQKPNELRRSKLNMAAALLACGIDPQRSILFEQSRVPAHSELAWIFNCITPVGWLGRMTQWKSKLGHRTLNHAQILSDERLTAGLRMGLFDYPVLQAADILLYRGTHVPVGADQLQHLELSREIATMFNNTFNTTLFPCPDAILPPVNRRVMSLRDPSSKMSKSDPSDASRINLTDSPEVIEKKIAKAITDAQLDVTYDPEERPGVSNLVGIYAAMHDMDTSEAVISLQDVSSTKELKSRVTDAVVTRLGPIQTKLAELHADMGYVQQVLDKGAASAAEIASGTMDKVHKAVGLRS